MTDHAFTSDQRRAVYRVIAERRDMRRFSPGSTVPDEVLARLLAAAHAAPSVGLMQPWRFIRVTDDGLRRRIHALVDAMVAAIAMSEWARNSSCLCSRTSDARPA